MFRFLLMPFLFLSVAQATDLALQQLPTRDANEWDLFSVDFETGTTTYVPPGTEQPALLYLRFSAKHANECARQNPPCSAYRWVTGQDRRIIVPPSKVQGFRLGLRYKPPTEVNQLLHPLNWYELRPNGYDFKKVTDRIRPQVYRDDPTQGRVITERVPDEWVNWGGHLDPIYVTPGCELKADPMTVEKGKQVLVSMTTSGTVSSADIEGISINPKGGAVAIFPTRTGNYPILGTVKSSEESRTCRVDVLVKDPVVVRPATCRLEISPKSIDLGGIARAKITTDGDVTEALIDGKAARFPSDDQPLSRGTPGTYSIEGKVRGPASPQWYTCSDSLEVKQPSTSPVSCKLEISPKQVVFGRAVTATLTGQGDIVEATIDGESARFPSDTKSILRRMIGFQYVEAKVRGRGQTTWAICRDSFEVVN